MTVLHELEALLDPAYSGILELGLLGLSLGLSIYCKSSASFALPALKRPASC